MSERLPKAENPFSSNLSAVLVGAGTLLFTLIFILLAWSPDLASKNKAGQHAYSKSALGFAGLVALLEADGQSVSISRLASTLDDADGPLIITLPSYGLFRAPEIDLLSVSEPTLYVLPKWTGLIDREKPSWQKDTDLMSRERVAGLLATFDPEAEVWRLRNPGETTTPFGTHAPKFEHKMQVISSTRLTPVVDTPGGILLGKMPDREIYILSDPDLFNTFGISQRENAGFALSLIDWLKDVPGQTVTLDATFHGFERSESLLRAIFDVPFLGATLVAFATLLLVGWAAFIRFAPPERDPSMPVFGKKALAESSAGLISMARREGQMAPSYAQVIERDLRRRLDVPASTTETEFADTLDRLAEQEQLSAGWRDRQAQLAEPAAGRHDLRDKALLLWRWRQEMKNGN